MPYGRRFELRGATALVTGASAGIGLAVSRRLAAAGARLVLAARNAQRLEEAANALAGPERVLAVSTDVGRLPDLEQLVGRAVDRFGSIDVLVNNAGVEAFAHFETVSPDRIIDTIQVNLTSALMLTRLVLPFMLRARRGHVVNMASTAGKHGPAYGAVYGASKAGLIAATQSLRAEYRGRGVSASVICPGFTDNGGIYDRMKSRTGQKSPRTVGQTTVDRVAKAVVRAIERDIPELIVNSPPLRPAFILSAMFPALGGALIAAATGRFLKRVADSNKSQ